MDGVLDWLTELPLVALYAMLAAAAALENIFPPLPADTVVAFGAFLAARGQGTALASFLATWGGNLIGAAIMYGVGRRYGTDFVRRHVPGLKGEHAEERLRKLHGKYGLVGIFLSRFLPGVRAVVPPFAGALHLPAVPSLVAMGAASGLWYGAVTILAFQVGESWEELLETVKSLNRAVGIGAAIVVGLAIVVWYVLRRRKRA